MPKILIAINDPSIEIEIPDDRVDDVNDFIQADIDYLQAWQDLRTGKMPIEEMNSVNAIYHEAVCRIWDIIGTANLSYKTMWRWK